MAFLSLRWGLVIRATPGAGQTCSWPSTVCTTLPAAMPRRALAPSFGCNRLTHARPYDLHKTRSEEPAEAPDHRRRDSAEHGTGRRGCGKHQQPVTASEPSADGPNANRHRHDLAHARPLLEVGGQVRWERHLKGSRDPLQLAVGVEESLTVVEGVGLAD